MDKVKHRLAIITTHPIQYYAPFFRLLASNEEIVLKVFYTYEKEEVVYDKGFGKSFSWDIPLLQGYDYCFVSNKGNKAKDFWSVNNPSLIDEISKWGATAVMVYGWNYRSHLRAIRHFKGKIPVIFRGDSHLLNKRPFYKSFLRKIFLTWVYRHIDFALYVGSANKAYYKEFGVAEHKLVFGPHAIDNKRFYNLSDEQKQELEKLKTGLKIKTGEIYITFCGKFQQVKNPLLLINAFRLLKQDGIHLLMIGDGELESSLRSAAENDDRITFLPFQNQSAMPLIYRLGQIFCLPSVSETWGLSINEAMACCNVILASDKVGAAQDLIIGGENGYSFKSNDVTDLKDKLSALISKKDQLGEMGNRSKEIISNRWTYEICADALTRILNNSPVPG